MPLSMKNPDPEPQDQPVPENLLPPIPPEEFKACLQVLQALAENPDYLAHVPPHERILLMKAAGRVAHPTIVDNRRLARAARKLRRETRKTHDRGARRNSGI